LRYGKKGLIVTGLDNNDKLDVQLSNLEKTIKENIKTGFYRKLDSDLKSGHWWKVYRRIQISIPEAQQENDLAKPAKTPDARSAVR
jgi:hypothetical protein